MVSAWGAAALRGADSFPVQPAVRAEKTAHVIARRIGQAIIDGELVPGTRLTEAGLAERYSVSRTPIREALLVLAGSGLIVHEANRGATVSQLTPADVAEAYHVRAVLESEAAALSADMAPPHLVGVLYHACDELHALRGATAARQLAVDTRFHYAIAEAAGSKRLHAMIRQVSAISEAYRSSFAYSGPDMDEAEHQHRTIADAIGRSDRASAGEAMRRHVLWAGELAVHRLGARLAATCTDGRSRP